MQENLLGLCICKEMRHADEMYDLEARKHSNRGRGNLGYHPKYLSLWFFKTEIRIAPLAHNYA